MHSPLENKLTPHLLTNKEEFVYTSHFCEENIWMMASKIRDTFPDQLQYYHPVFISNNSGHIPLWRQSVSKQEDGLVIWDYHVIMVYKNANESLVFDFDTTLPFPAAFEEYCRETFKSDDFLNPEFHRLFRVLSADLYLNHFSSDRSHMKKEDGSWVKPPPSYPPIKNSDDHNLGQYISMKEHGSTPGTVLKLSSFIDRFSRKHSQPFRTLNIDYTNPPEPSGCNNF